MQEAEENFVTKTAVFIALIAFILIARALPVYAQSSKFSYKAVTNAPVGSWAEYTLSFKGRPNEVKQKYTMVETTRPRLVLEIETTMPIGPAVSHLE